MNYCTPPKFIGNYKTTITDIEVRMNSGSEPVVCVHLDVSKAKDTKNKVYNLHTLSLNLRNETKNLEAFKFSKLLKAETHPFILNNRASSSQKKYLENFLALLGMNMGDITHSNHCDIEHKLKSMLIGAELSTSWHSWQSFNGEIIGSGPGGVEMALIGINKEIADDAAAQPRAYTVISPLAEVANDIMHHVLIEKKKGVYIKKSFPTEDQAMAFGEKYSRKGDTVILS
jgi:hypothetical protein